jgi:hypothetical protein
MEYSWNQMRDNFSNAVDDSPSAEMEERVLIVFRSSPALVEASMNKVIAAQQAGRVRSPWPFLATAVEQRATGAGADVIVSDADERQKALRQAKMWLRNAGVHYDRWAEVDEELFERGMMRPWADDETLRANIQLRWQELRPLGERVEREELERAEHFKQVREQTK